MDHNSINGLSSLIQERAKQYHALKENEDEWEYETIEMEVIQSIFRYAVSTGFSIEGYDLLKILDAEDDEDEAVPPEGVDATLVNLMPEIHPEDGDDTKFNPDVLKIWDEFYRAFWPLYFED